MDLEAKKAVLRKRLEEERLAARPTFIRRGGRIVVLKPGDKWEGKEDKEKDDE